MLLVTLKSSLKGKCVVSLDGEMKTTPAPADSLVHAPSESIVQRSFSPTFAN